MGSAGPMPDQEQRYLEAVTAHGAALERLARAYERDLDGRRDLLQEIHIALWRSLARFDGRCSLRTWVYRVAHNTATSKTLRPRASAPIFVALDDSLESLPDAAGSEETLDRGLALNRVYELIQRLRPLDRQVILLYLEALDAKSIGDITGLSAMNVATKIGRLKRILASRFHEGGRGVE